MAKTIQGGGSLHSKSFSLPLFLCGKKNSYIRFFIPIGTACAGLLDLDENEK